MSEELRFHSPIQDLEFPAKKFGSIHFDFESPHHYQGPTQPSSTTNFDLELAKIEGEKEIVIRTAVDQQAQIKVLRGWILLNKGISARNFYFSWVYILYFGFILISFSTLEPQFINQSLGVPTDEMGQITALLYLIDYSVRLVFAAIFGPMIDYYGRKVVMTIGIIFVSLGYLLIPLFSSTLFPNFVIAKSFLSCGIIALSMLPFSADYVDNSTKGVITGINFGMGFVGGACAGVFIKVLLLYNFSYKTIYLVQSPMLLIIGFLLRTGIKPGNTYYKVLQNDDVEIENKRFKWMEVRKAFREIPWVTISIIFGVLGNTDFYIMTTGLMIWLKSLMPPDEDPTIIATTYQVIFFGLSVLLTVITALKIDKVSHMKMIFPVLIVATLGFMLIPLAQSPQSLLVYAFFIIEGFSLPGVFVFSTYLAIRYNPPEIRGTLSGIGNCVGFLGAIIILSLGGYLHDKWRSDASFILYGSLLCLTLITVTIINCKMKKSKKKSEIRSMIKFNN